MTKSAEILLVDDEQIAITNLEHVLTKQGYRTIATQSATQALQLLEQHAFDVVLTDLRMEKVDGMQVLKRCRELQLDTEVILITGYASLESAVEAMRRGAFYYLAKPFRLDEVRKVVHEAVEKVRLKKENRRLRSQLDHHRPKVSPITQDPHMQQLLDTARQVAQADCNVLVSGASGTGKELVARYIHAHSTRAQGPFLAINCGAFNVELLANELFGHEKGAFTGAGNQKKGLIEMANGGTLLLDEITEMAPAMQVKLLRVIQEREVLRLGATQASAIDVRFIAATNRDLQEAIETGDLRRDLYFRLNVAAFHLPPLLQRIDDVPLLSHYFLEKYSLLMGRELNGIAPDALDLLMQHDYPGNVRELENIIERSVVLARGKRIELGDLPDELRQMLVRAARRTDGSIPSLDEQERTYIEWVLREVAGNKTQAAQLLGIDRVSLWRKLKKYSLEPQ
jgi:DNA-binding NtrC family response regulator